MGVHWTTAQGGKEHTAWLQLKTGSIGNPVARQPWLTLNRVRYSVMSFFSAKIVTI